MPDRDLTLRVLHWDASRDGLDDTVHATVRHEPPDYLFTAVLELKARHKKSLSTHRAVENELLRGPRSQQAQAAGFYFLLNLGGHMGEGRSVCHDLYPRMLAFPRKCE